MHLNIRCALNQRWSPGWDGARVSSADAPSAGSCGITWSCRMPLKPFIWTNKRVFRQNCLISVQIALLYPYFRQINTGFTKRPRSTPVTSKDALDDLALVVTPMLPQIRVNTSGISCNTLKLKTAFHSCLKGVGG